MGFSGGGSNILKAHTHNGLTVQDGGALDFDNITQSQSTAGMVFYSDGAHLQQLAYPGVPAGETLTAAAASSAPSWASAGGASVTIVETAMTTGFTSTSIGTLVDVTGLSLVKPNITGGKCITTVYLSCENNSSASCTFALEDNGVVVSRMETAKSTAATNYCGTISLSDVSDADGNTVQVQGMAVSAGNWSVNYNATYSIAKIVCLAVG